MDYPRQMGELFEMSHFNKLSISKFEFSSPLPLSQIL